MRNGWMRRLDERSLLADFQRDTPAFFAPLNSLLAVGAVVGAPFVFALGPTGGGVFLLVVAVWLGLFAWAGWRLRRHR